jgi:hypothetical protein
MTRNVRYYVYDRNGTRQPGTFLYGTLINAIKLAMEVDGVIYDNAGRLKWCDWEHSEHTFRPPKEIPFRVAASGRLEGAFCICDQCQGEWEK